MGYPTETKAITMAQDININNITHTPTGVKSFYDIYETHVSYVHETTINDSLVADLNIDKGITEQQNKLVLVSDTMYWLGKCILCCCSYLCIG